MHQFNVWGFIAKMRVLLICVLLLLFFNTTFLAVLSDGCFFDRLRFAASHSLGFLLTVDSPNGLVDKGDSLSWMLCRVFSWMTSGVGWLFIPIAVGQLVTSHIEELVALRRMQSELRLLAKAEGKTQAEADAWTEKMMNNFIELMKAHKEKAEE